MPAGSGRAGRVWHVSERERTLPFPCDAYLAEPDDVYFRGIEIQAPAVVVFRWLCQLRLAPYSYDWIDNLGRHSPRELTPGLERLELGQRVMTIFELVEFEPDRQLTVRLRRASLLFGEVAVTYMLLPVEPGGCRLLVKVPMRHSRRLPGWRLRHTAMPWLDLVMMRKQLLTIKHLAEQQARGGGWLALMLCVADRSRDARGRSASGRGAR
jgi:hypothetical protein